MSIEVAFDAPDWCDSEKLLQLRQQMEDKDFNKDVARLLTDISSQFPDSPEYTAAYEALTMAGQFHRSKYKDARIQFTPFMGVVDGEDF